MPKESRQMDNMGFTDEDVLHAMRFLGTEDREKAIRWLVEQDRRWREQNPEAE